MLKLWNAFAGIESAIVSLFLLIDSIIYNAFSWLYNLYLDLASARIFDENLFSSVVENVYIVLGVVSLFVIAYLLIKIMINPDDTGSGKQIKDMIVRFVLATILTIFVPTIFQFIYNFQNSLLSNNVVPKLILGTDTNMSSKKVVEYVDDNGNPIFTEDCKASSLEEAKKTCTKLEESVDINILNSYGNSIAYYVMSGFMYPNTADGYTAKDVVVNASEHFNLSHNVKWAGGACAVGGTAATIGVVTLEVLTAPTTGFATLAAIPGTIASFSSSIAAACAIGAGSSLLLNKIGYEIDYEKYSWENAQLEIINTGDFDRITSFSSSIAAGEMHYSAVISTIAGIILLYLIFSFCLDLGVRAAKLLFYQAIAPITFFMSVIPSNSELLSKWFKAVSITFFEVFVRILTICMVTLLVGKIDYDSLVDTFGHFATAIIILGIVTFARQLPKLLSEVLGIDSSNMKIGIREKLAEGGAFTAGAIIGGGATAFAKNSVNAGKNIRNKYRENRLNGKGKIESFGKSSGAFIGGIGSVVAGTLSAQFRSGKAGLNAKSVTDMKKAASSGAKGAVDARVYRAKYKKEHGGTILGSTFGHIADVKENLGRWAEFAPDYSELKSEQETSNDFLKSINSIKSVGEDYISKHQSEFYVGATESELTAIENIRRDIENNKKTNADLDNYIASVGLASKRLDILEANIAYQEAHGTAVDVANARKEYNKGKKDTLDAFAKNVHNHVGAEKEALTIREELNVINDKLSDNINSRVVAKLHVGTDDGIVKATAGNVNTDNADVFIKQLKNSVEHTNAEINKEYQKLQRKQQNNSGSES